MAPRKRQRPNPNLPAPLTPAKPPPVPNPNSDSSSSATPRPPSLVSQPTTTTATSSAAAATYSTSPASDTTVAAPTVSTVTSVSAPALVLASSGDNASMKQVHKTRSWYGSWPRTPGSSKSAASTRLARETIFGDTTKPSIRSDLTKFDTKRPSKAGDIAELSQGMGGPVITNEQNNDNGSGDTMAINAADMSRDAKSATEPLDTNRNTGGNEQASKPQEGADTSELADAGDTADRDSERTVVEDTPPTDVQPTPPRPDTSSGWLTWLGRSPTVPQGTPTTTEGQSGQKIVDEEPSKAPGAEEMEIEEEQTPEPTPKPDNDTSANKAKEPEVQGRPETQSGSISSWFTIWPASNNVARTNTPEQPTVSQSEVPKEPEDTAMPDVPEPVASTAETSTTTTQMSAATLQQEPAPKAGSTWAFWSRDTPPSKSGSDPTASGAATGELAVMGEGSESHPKAATEAEVNESPVKGASKDPKAKGTPPTPIPDKKSKRMRPQSMDLDTPSSTPPKMSTSLKSDSGVSTPKQLPSDPPQKPLAAALRDAAANKSSPPNIVLPSFTSTYRMKENPSILKQIANLLLRTQQPEPHHLFLSRDPPRVKKAIAIGVHGLIPARYLTPMIGAPTGTSIRFANLAADAIRRWADTHGCEDCEIEKVALEGEGKIAERVDNLWKLLLNWIEHLREADLVIVACHSQGVPVSIMLLAKLIDLGIITRAKIGVCAMAGVSLGPFPDYKSSMGILMGSAAELWEFSNPQSEVSQRYEHALREVLHHGVRVTFVGSIDDQLVPMASAIHSPVNHPNIYRAVFIDGRIHAPDFIAHLVGFALKLRNLGISDHGLIRELSVPLAGSLYSGEGHSRIYYENQVYDLALSHALETTDTPHPTTCSISHVDTPLASPNPYHLPWVMRGLLEEDFVKTELSRETDELLRQFDAWKPVTKALRDVKYRLEAVRSKI